MKIALLFLLVFCLSCNKLIDIDPPTDSVSDEFVFTNDEGAITAMTGIYTQLINSQTDLEFSSGGITVLAGLSADEFFYSGTQFQEFFNNAIRADNNFVRLYLWEPVYDAIHQANTCIEGLNTYEGVTPALKEQLIGEAKFLRAFCFFNLVNLYGNVPLTLTTDWRANAPMPRTPSGTIYNQVVADLLDAKNRLAADFLYSNNERTRVNKWAAISLLARTYLFMTEWQKAETEASAVIDNSSLFNLESDLKNAFSKNSRETIWQLAPSNLNSPYAIPEAYNIIPQHKTKDHPPDIVNQYWHLFVPPYSLSSGLLNSFENGDLRKQSWCDSTGNLNGTNYFYPAKYKTRQGEAGVEVSEYYTVLRLAELYLIRAEARAKQNKLPGAISDVNMIRSRAGLTGLSNSLNGPQLLSAIAQEKRIEFFSEWGHRWFDLKRRGKSEEVLVPLKGSNWQNHDMLYPIPLSEIQKAPNLLQNPGY
jgi:hypothetical protein